jgi:hypothetical protein
MVSIKNSEKKANRQEEFIPDRKYFSSAFQEDSGTAWMYRKRRENRAA